MVPPQAKSEEDFIQIQAMGSSASGSMIFTLIVPFCFMLFMSFSMNRVWALYNMLQLLSNFNNYLTMTIPANAYFIVNVMMNVTFFSIL